MKKSQVYVTKDGLMQIRMEGFRWRTSDSSGTISKHPSDCWPQQYTGGLISICHEINGAGGDEAVNVSGHKKE